MGEPITWPPSLGAQEIFDDFRDGAITAAAPRDESGNPLDRWNRVSDGDGETAPAHRRQVGKVVPDVRCFGGLAIALAQDVLKRIQLVFGAATHAGNTKLLKAQLQRRAASSGNDRERQPALPSELHRGAVLDVKPFDRFGFAIHVQSAVGQHAVNVEYEKLDARQVHDGTTSK